MYSKAVAGLVSHSRQQNVDDILRLQASRCPDKVALVYEGVVDSFANFNRSVDRAANALLALGLAPGDRVACLSHNNRSFIMLRFAVIRAGGVFTPINFMLNAREVAYILEHSGPTFLLVEDSLCATADQAITLIGSPQIIKAALRHETGSIPEGWNDGDAWLMFDDDRPVINERGADDPVQLMYTSGTESRPKGVLLSSRALFAQYVTCIVDGGMTGDDIDLHTLPLYHCAQLDCFLTVDLYLGATSLLLRGPDPGVMLETIEREAVTRLFCPPTVWISLLRHPDFDRRDLSSLKKGYYGASIMPSAVIVELLERIPGLRLWNLYGQTEMAPLATILKPEDQLRKLGSAGKPGINVETRVVDDEDRELPRGVVGEIVHRSPQAMLGYFEDEAKTAEAFRNGWLHSGDLGRMDEEGYLYVVDRKKDMIKTGGENVASREVEDALYAHPQISEVAVVGLPDERWIEAVTAVIVPRPGELLGIADVEAFCRENLAGYKRPKRIFFRTALPKNASGKILKRELREQLLGEQV